MFSILSNSLLSINFRISGPTKTPSFIFVSDRRGKQVRKKLLESLSKALTNCLNKPNLICRGGKIILCVVTKGMLMTLCSPASVSSFLGYCSFFVLFATSSGIPKAQKTTILRVA